MAFYGDQIAVTTTATSLTALLATAGLTVKNPHFSQIDLRIDPGSANTIYAGGSGVTNAPANAAIALVAATTPSFTWGPTISPVINSDQIFLVATTGTTTCFVSLVV